ncbi:ComEC/Rec2 family competence protein [Bacillus dakarensis]|uniref:ComEC/Rec2 family competence protein n=1 Tax=Robertmurraya dakarensis TaxID=1926278 RepID=UPI00098166B9|nr:MBL fold metallo-hydrolase [Bacillus dakarensis]
MISIKNVIIVCLSLFISNLIGGCSYSASKVTNENGVKDNLDIVIFKIGKADSILLSMGDQTVLIDTGEDEDGEEIIDYMEKNKITMIDYLILTHFDKDHVGGVDTILNEVEVLNVISPNYESDSKDYKKYMVALEDHDIAPLKLTNVFIFKVGTAQFTIDPPRKDTYSGDNDYSLVISVEHGKNRFLFAGDAEEKRLTELIESGNLEHTLLKVPHHGRYNDKSTEFFTLIHPKYAVITSSDKNPEEKEVIDVLKQLGTEVYVTRNGDILIFSDGESLRINQ